MSVYYYLSFEPMNKDRQSALEPVLEILHRMEVQIDTDYFRLLLRDGIFEYTYEEIESPSLVTAVDRTRDWDGVQAHFTYNNRLCYLLLLNDVPGCTTVMIGEPGPLFEEQQKDSETQAAFLELIEDAMDILEVKFCVFEPEWENRSRTMNDLNALLNDVSNGISRDWTLLVADHALISQNAITEKIRESYSCSESPRSRRWVLSRVGLDTGTDAVPTSGK